MPSTSVGYFAPTWLYATSLGITVPAGTDTLLLFVQHLVGTPDATATLGAQSFSVAQDTPSFAYGQRSCRLLRLDSPAAGSGTVELAGTTIRGFALVALDDVDTTDLFTSLAAETHTDTSDDTFEVTLSSAADDLTLLFAGASGSGGTHVGDFIASAGSTLGTKIVSEGAGVCVLEEAGATSVTLGVDPTNVGGTDQLHVGLIYCAVRASGGAPTVTDYTMVYRRAMQAAAMGD
jgi:hypothetical protein